MLRAYLKLGVLDKSISRAYMNLEVSRGILGYAPSCSPGVCTGGGALGDLV
jgi:hypothetical protein